jgi:hypothetical protein
MIAWLVLKTGMSALLIKIILFAVATAGILYGLRLWGNAQWAKGEKQGRVSAVQTIEKAKKEEWKIKEAEIASKKIKIEKKMVEVDAASKQLMQDKTILIKGLKDELAKIDSKKPTQPFVVVSSVPDSELDGALRSLSNRLAAAH